LPYIDSDPGTDAHYQPFDVSEDYRDEFKLGSLNVKYTTPVLELSSITSYWSRNEPLNQDTSESWTTGLGLTGYTPAQGGIGAASAIEYNPTHQTTEELRVSSVGDANPKWLVGYFYEDFHSAWDIVFPSQNGAAIYGSNNLFSYFSPMQDLPAIGVRRGHLQRDGALRHHRGGTPLPLQRPGQHRSIRCAHGDRGDLDGGEGPGRHAQDLAVL
jgi:hypothetical protein